MKKSKAILHTDLVGKDWLYQGTAYHIIKVENNGTRIITDKRTWTFGDEEERDYWLASIEPTDPPAQTNLPAKGRAEYLPINITADINSTDIFSKMLGELEFDFNEMKTKPEYVPVAKQRANQVNTMTNLVKTRIALERLNRA